MYYTYLERTPVGKLLLVGDENGLCELSYDRKRSKIQKDWTENHSFFKEPIRQLKEYFKGKRTTFDLKLAPWGTAFQLSVLKSLQKIPYGETVSYSDIAESIHNPKAVRAVGLANGRNPISIIIPCHRVIGKNGTLTGYGGGLKNKKVLLELERAL